MIIVNNGSVENQQNNEQGDTGYLYAAESKDISESKEVKEIRKIIEENCPQEMQNILLSIISELIESIKENREEAKNVSTWTNKLYMAVTGMGSMASIVNASWWPTLIESIKNLLQRL